MNASRAAPVKSRAADSARTVSTCGRRRSPRSSALTAWTERPAIVASSSCVNPAVSRNALSCVPNDRGAPTFITLVLRPAILRACTPQSYVRRGPQRPNSHHVCFRMHQEPGKSTRGADVVRQTPCRPPGGDAGVCDDVAVDGVLNAMGREPTNDDPWASLESGNGRDHEQRHEDGFEKHGSYRTDHCRKQHVVRRNYHQHRWIKRSIAIESHPPGEERNADREDHSGDIWQHHHLLHLCVTRNFSNVALECTACTTSRIAWIEVCAAV